MKKSFQRLAVWFMVLVIGLAGNLGVFISNAKASSLPQVQFVNTSSSGSEKISVARFGVILSEKSSSDVTVDFKITGGTAVSGKNFRPYNGTVNIKAHELMRNVPLYVYDDLVGGGNKTVEITLSNPNSHAVLGANRVYTYTILEDNTPLTTASLNPGAPNGLNDWYVTTPSVALQSDRKSWTYYQWNDNIGGHWKNYAGALTVPEGVNTLYYYSKDAPGGFKEDVKRATIKVDTVAPGTPTVTIAGDNGVVDLSWDLIGDANGYEISRDGGIVAAVGKDQNSYRDLSVTLGQAYSYKIVAIDLAGNRSMPVVMSVTVKNATNTVAVRTVSKTIYKNIGTGASISKGETIAPQVQGDSNVTGVTETADEDKKDAGDTDWSRLLLAISILIIAAGAAIAGYYGYEWWMAKKDNPEKTSQKKKSRW